MDLETEVAELRHQAQREGALAYLHQPTVRSKPNSRFLTATVRGVQQANRVVEVNEMWRLREKQLELDNRLNGPRNGSSSGRGYKDVCESRRSKSIDSNEVEASGGDSLSSKKRFIWDLDPMEDEGLRDYEVDKFLHSRTKRGRGAVGSRMDETGPYLPSSPDSKRNLWESDAEELKKSSVLLGPEKPCLLKSGESSNDEPRKDKKSKAKIGSSKRQSRKHKSKEKLIDKKKRRKEKKTKHDK